jgi:hypothetical protein
MSVVLTAALSSSYTQSRIQASGMRWSRSHMNATLSTRRPLAVPCSPTVSESKAPLRYAVPHGVTTRPPGRVCATHAEGTCWTAAVDRTRS